MQNVCICIFFFLAFQKYFQSNFQFVVWKSDSILKLREIIHEQVLHFNFNMIFCTINLTGFLEKGKKWQFIL